MNSFVRFALCIMVILTMILSAGCMSTGHRGGPGGPGGYGHGPQSAGFQPGDYALQEAQSLQRVQEFASCNGEGYSETRSQSRTSERNGQRGGYDVRVEQRASCTKFGGNSLPPLGSGIRPVPGGGQ